MESLCGSERGVSGHQGARASRSFRRTGRRIPFPAAKLSILALRMACTSTTSIGIFHKVHGLNSCGLHQPQPCATPNPLFPKKYLHMYLETDLGAVPESQSVPCITGLIKCQLLVLCKVTKIPDILVKSISQRHRNMFGSGYRDID